MMDILMSVKQISFSIKRFLFLFFLSVHSICLFAQPAIDTAAIKLELADILYLDQKTRISDDSAKFRATFDSLNLIKVTLLIEKYGWPGKSFVGNKGNYTVWLVIQHADLNTQLKYLSLLQQSVADGESRPCDLALLEDRILMRQDKKQSYGSQIWFNKMTGQQEIWPIEDEIHLNERRLKVGLEPMEDYAKHFGIEYLPIK